MNELDGNDAAEEVFAQCERAAYLRSRNIKKFERRVPEWDKEDWLTRRVRCIKERWRRRGNYEHTNHART